MDIGFGFPREQADEVSELFWQGFSGKLSRPLGGKDRATRFFAETLDPRTTVTASEDDQPLAAMVITDREHLSSSAIWSVARRTYGTIGAIPRLVMLAGLDTKPPKGALHIEWIAVAPNARGRRVGSKLIEFAYRVAQERGLHSLTLDVVDSNPRAQALYERLGFEVVSTKSAWPFRWLYQIRSSTRMVKPVS